MSQAKIRNPRFDIPAIPPVGTVHGGRLEPRPHADEREAQLRVALRYPSKDLDQATQILPWLARPNVHQERPSQTEGRGHRIGPRTRRAREVRSNADMSNMDACRIDRM